MAQSVWDTILSAIPQTSGLMAASKALGIANAKQTPAGQAADPAAQLAKLKKDGPPDAFHTKDWQDQVDALTKQLSGPK